MKRHVSIFLICLMMVNTLGYYGSLLWMESSAKTYVRDKISATADDMGGSLIIKLPISLPYPIHTEAYTPANGTISYQGRDYRMIKQRLYHDTLFVVCVMDPEQTIINGKVKAYADAMAEAGQDESNEVKQLVPVGKYCLSPSYRLLVQDSGWVRTNTYGETVNFYQLTLPQFLLRPPTSPPFI